MSLLTNRLTGMYSNPATPHCVVVGRSPVNHDAQPRPHAVFLCVLHGNIVMMGCVGKPSGLPVRDTGLRTPHSPSPLFRSLCDGLKTLYHESVIMQNLTINPSVISVASHIAVIDGKPTTTTQDIAQAFDKRHDDVLRIVRQRMAEVPEEWRVRNFTDTVVERQNPSGGSPIKSPVIRMTKKGFAFVVQKFTGKKAVQVQLAYVDEFERMEEALRGDMPRLSLTNGQHFIVAKDGVVIYHKPLSDRISNRYLQPRITQSKECQQAQQLLADLQAINSMSGTVDYDQVRAALRQLLIHLNNHQPFSQVKSTVTVLEAIERLFVRMWTMIDESDFRVTMIQHAAAKGQPLTEGNVQTLNNIKAILARQMLRVELPVTSVGGV